MNDIFDRMEAGENIDDIMPYDLTGFSKTQAIQILAAYVTYGKDPERRKICKQKWRDILGGRLNVESRTDSIQDG